MTAEIAAALTALKAASDITRALAGLRDAAIVQSKVIDLQQEILAAQASTLAVQEAQSALLQSVRDLEAEVAGLKAWHAEKQKYELTEVHTGVFAYKLKPDNGTAEPSHSLCSRCFQDGHKSILQSASRGSTKVLNCLRCNADIVVGYHQPGAARIVSR